MIKLIIKCSDQTNVSKIWVGSLIICPNLHLEVKDSLFLGSQVVWLLEHQLFGLLLKSPVVMLTNELRFAIYLVTIRNFMRMCQNLLMTDLVNDKSRWYYTVFHIHWDWNLNIPSSNLFTFIGRKPLLYIQRPPRLWFDGWSILINLQPGIR